MQIWLASESGKSSRKKTQIRKDIKVDFENDYLLLFKIILIFTCLSVGRPTRISVAPKN
jgi:hypothetical protein